jgi:hypothetical protein
MTAMKQYLLIIITLGALNSFALSERFQVKDNNRKGDFYLYWGWNNSSYTNSDIQFTGKDYDFTLGNVAATDKQTPFDVNVYFHPGKVTIPQYNARIGYFFSDHCEISFGVDHMKYVVVEDQTVIMNGEVGTGNSRFEGKYINDQRVLSTDFLTYEHTDGLNYINVSFKRYDDVLQYKKFRLGVSEGVELGGVMPKTNVTLMGSDRYDKFNWAGYGFSGIGAVTLRIYNHFFIQSEMKAGFIDMGAIRTTADLSDSARQNFFYLQGNLLFGFSVSLSKKAEAVMADDFNLSF